MTLATLIFRLLLFFGVLFLLDLYAYQGVKFLTASIASGKWRNGIRLAYWAITLSFLVLSIAMFFIPSAKNGPSSGFVAGVFGYFVMMYLPKLIFLFFVLADDMQMGLRFLIDKITLLWSPENISVHTGEGNTITRSQFILKAGVITAAIPFATVIYGILKGRYDYTVRKVKVPVKGLPKVFEGFRITQISDIHMGSFDNRDAVKRGIEMINQQHSDIICFTGDLVNNKVEEAEPWLDLFSSLKAPMGVFSVLGNHDYGDYVRDWLPGEKEQNFGNMIQWHARAGWKLLMNEHVMLKKGDDSIALIGIENWGARGGFSRYGNMQKALEDIPDTQVKVLLSHDPSHWEAEVIPKYNDIQLVLAGHTHGFQFGVEIPGLKWSPVQYVYKQWAGLYTQGNQHLYVNRGFGFIGFPGRIGILPEITVLELTAA